MILLLFSSLLICLLLVNFATFSSYQSMGIATLVPLDSLIFLLIGIILLGISCFSMLQLNQYKTGRLFAFYVLLLGLSIALAPCSRLKEPLIATLRVICTFGSSLLLFRVIGHLTLLISKMMFKVFQAILICVAIVGMIVQVLSLFPLENLWIYIVAAESINGSIFLSALFCLMIMGINYRKSNAYARKQNKILFLGIGIGMALFLLASFIPNVYLIQNQQAETEAIIELSLIPTETIIASIPLLLFSGVSISIIFMLMHRGFVLKNMRLKLRYFIVIPIYFFVVNVLIFTYMNCPLWLLFAVNVLLLLPLFIGMQKIFCPTNHSEEQTYQWRLLEAIEKEKQDLSSYLHDEVLQSLIAFYRQIQSDETGRYTDMKSSLSGLISQIRNVSHNLYPTMVEDLGLEQSLSVFMEELPKSYTSIKVNYRYELSDGILPKSLALAFYRISKELVINAAKHSGGLEVSLSLKEDCNGYYIHVWDNGNGFPLPHNDDLLQSPHMGIYTVKRQVSGLQGQIDFESNPKTGTNYNIYFPKKEKEEFDA